jgi:hypothetical protein
VTVNNVAPSDLKLTLAPEGIDVGGSTVLSGTFVDPGTQDAHTVVIDWGDTNTDRLTPIGPLDYDLVARSAAGTPLPAPASKAGLGPPADALDRLRVSDGYALDLLPGPKADDFPILDSQTESRARPAHDLALLNLMDSPIQADLLSQSPTLGRSSRTAT